MNMSSKNKFGMENIHSCRMFYFMILCCFALFHESIGNDRVWPKPKSGSNPYGTIDIDNAQGFYDGSADRELSGNGPHEIGSDDEDDLDLSGGHEISYTGLTTCQRQREIAMKTDGFIPRCNHEGDYEALQCYAGFCWCVNDEGKEISNSRTPENHQTLDCRNLDRVQTPVRLVPPDATPPKSTKETDNKGDKTLLGDGRRREDTSGNDFDSEKQSSRLQIFDHPGILAGVIGGAVFGLLCAVLLVMFIVYRMRKNDDSSYPMKTPQVGYIGVQTYA